MNNAKLEHRLKELKQEQHQYDWIKNKLFDDPRRLTEDERVKFTEENIVAINELQSILKEIRDIEWQLMGPEKQQEYINKYKED